MWGWESNGVSEENEGWTGITFLRLYLESLEKLSWSERRVMEQGHKSSTAQSRPWLYSGWEGNIYQDSTEARGTFWRWHFCDLWGCALNHKSVVWILVQVLPPWASHVPCGPLGPFLGKWGCWSPWLLRLCLNGPGSCFHFTAFGSRWASKHWLLWPFAGPRIKNVGLFGWCDSFSH